MPELENDLLSQLLDAAHELRCAELGQLADAVDRAREVTLHVILSRQQELQTVFAGANGAKVHA